MIFSVLAFISLMISACIKKRNKSLVIQSISCMFESIYDFTISAYTAAILSIFNAIRTYIFIKKDIFNKSLYILFLLIFEGIIIINCCFTWAGYISLLPTIGSVIRTYCLWQSKMKYVRLSAITTGLFYGIYYLHYHSWFMVLGDILLIITGVYALYKNDIKNLRTSFIS